MRSSIGYVLTAGIESLVLTGSTAISGTGNSGDNWLSGAENTAANVLTGGLGNDVYLLGAGDTAVELPGEGVDTVQIDRTFATPTTFSIGEYANVEAMVLGTLVRGGHTLVGSAAAETLSYLGRGVGDVIAGDPDAGGTVLAGGGNDTVRGGAGNDTLDGGTGADTLLGDAGDDTYRVDDALDVVVEGIGQGIDRVEASADFTLPENVEWLVAAGAQGVRLTGTAAHDRIDGASSAAADTLIGLGGDDHYIAGANDVIVEAVGGGEDQVDAYGSITVAENIERVGLLGIGDANVLGNAASNTVWGNAGANQISTLGGDDAVYLSGGTDRIEGGAGQDSYFVDWGGFLTGSHSISTIADTSSEGGVDRIVFSTYGAGWTTRREGDHLVFDAAGLPGEVRQIVVENAFAAGQASTVTSFEFIDGTETVASLASRFIVGTAGNDTLAGTALGDSLFGGGGNDSLSGGDGNDVLDGGDGADTLAGGPGADLLIGGAGDDLYLAVQAEDSIRESAAGGIDTIETAISFTLPAWIETLRLTGTSALSGTGNELNNSLYGNGAANTLRGGAGADWLDGGAGVDTMEGGVGDDTYVVDTSTDKATELAGEGTDTVRSSLTWTLGNHLENLVLTGTSAINGTGNALDNVLTGNAGNNTLNGGAGSDSMSGGAGNDTYVIDSVGDSVTELASEGTDLVQSSVSWILSANVENLTLTGSSAINATGNALNNVLNGNSGANVLDGGGGNDTMVGGGGNDTYIVDSTGDVVTEASGGGTDTVEASVSWALGSEVENLTLTGTAAINATGNALANVLRGNSANNTISGGAGSDTMIGGAGDDTYVVDATGDVVTEAASEGTDLVQSSVTYTLAANVENLTLTGTSAINATGNGLNNVLTGNSANNTLTGGAGNDTLDGGTGNDTMVGGSGDDTYVVNVSTDVVTELANEGVDTVLSGVTLTLGNHVENLTLTGTSAINGTGNTLNNVLTGNSANNTLTGAAGNDTLNGGAGNDTMVGGAGDDIYYVDSASDVVTEASGEGTDTVNSSVTLTLGSNVENLALTGGSSINGTGNTLNNVLTGNGAANTLTGLAGNDTLDGGAGNDTLVGGAGADGYLFGRGWGIDTVQENDTTASVVDRVHFGAGIVQAETTFVRNGNNLEVSISGTADKLIVQSWYLGSQYQVEEFKYADGSTVTNSQVAGLLSAMASFGGDEAFETQVLPPAAHWRYPEMQMNVL